MKMQPLPGRFDAWTVPRWAFDGILGYRQAEAEAGAIAPALHERREQFFRLPVGKAPAFVLDLDRRQFVIGPDPDVDRSAPVSSQFLNADIDQRVVDQVAQDREAAQQADECDVPLGRVSPLQRVGRQQGGTEGISKLVCDEPEILLALSLDDLVALAHVAKDAVFPDDGAETESGVISSSMKWGRPSMISTAWAPAGSTVPCTRPRQSRRKAYFSRASSSAKEGRVTR